MRTFLAVVGVLAVSSAIAYLWVRGIDHMKENHPDYKGEDMFDEGDIR